MRHFLTRLKLCTRYTVIVFTRQFCLVFLDCSVPNDLTWKDPIMQRMKYLSQGPALSTACNQFYVKPKETSTKKKHIFSNHQWNPPSTRQVPTPCRQVFHQYQWFLALQGDRPHNFAETEEHIPMDKRECCRIDITPTQTIEKNDSKIIPSLYFLLIDFLGLKIFSWALMRKIISQQQWRTPFPNWEPAIFAQWK